LRGGRNSTTTIKVYSRYEESGVGGTHNGNTTTEDETEAGTKTR
jgi:hypothetical protein